MSFIPILIVAITIEGQLSWNSLTGPSWASERGIQTHVSKTLISHWSSSIENTDWWGFAFVLHSIGRCLLFSWLCLYLAKPFFKNGDRLQAIFIALMTPGLPSECSDLAFSLSFFLSPGILQEESTEQCIVLLPKAEKLFNWQNQQKSLPTLPTAEVSCPRNVSRW